MPQNQPPTTRNMHSLEHMLRPPWPALQASVMVCHKRAQEKSKSWVGKTIVPPRPIMVTKPYSHSLLMLLTLELGTLVLLNNNFLWSPRVAKWVDCLNSRFRRKS